MKKIITKIISFLDIIGNWIIKILFLIFKFIKKIGNKLKKIFSKLSIQSRFVLIGAIGLILLIALIIKINHSSSTTSNLEFKSQLLGPWDYTLNSPEGNIKTFLGADKENIKMQVKRDKSRVTIATPLNGPEAKKEGDTVTYQTANDLVSVKYQPLPKGIKEEIILTADPLITSFVSKISLMETEPRVTPDGQIVFVNPGGEYQFHIQPPFAQDATGNTTYDIKYRIIEKESDELDTNQLDQKIFKHEATYLNISQNSAGQNRVSRQLLGPIADSQSSITPTKEYYLILEVDPNWLQNPHRQYPIIIDPTIVHDESSDFAGEFNRVEDTGAGSFPSLETEYREAGSRYPYSVYTSNVIDLTAISSWTDLAWDEWGVATGDGETLYDDTSLIAQWSFNETNGTTANNDAEGSSCGGTPSNCDGALTGFDSTSSQDSDDESTWTANEKRWGAGALKFDGVDSRVTVSDNSSLEPSSITIASWVKTDQSLQYAGWIDKRTGASDGYNIDFPDTTGTVRFVIELNGGGTNTVTSTTSINDNQWHYVVATYDQTNLKIYIDGVLENSTNESTAIAYGSSDLVIGGDGSTVHEFDGVLDSVSIYSRALPHHEILSNYNASDIEFQTRVGDNSSPDDGSWEEWKSTANENDLDNMDNPLDWATPSASIYTGVPIATSSSSLKVEGNGSLKIQTGIPKVESNTVALWRLDETNGDIAGDDAFDETTNNYDGEFAGTNIAAAVVDGISGKARDFNGTDDNIVLGSSSEANVTGDITIELWVKPTFQQASIVHKGYQYSLHIKANGDVTWADSSNYSYANFGDHDIGMVAGEWQHLAVTKSGSTVTIYRNGEVGISKSFGSAITSTSNTLLLGCYGDASVCTGYYYDGSMDEIRISNVAHSAEEVAEAYRAGRDHHMNKTLSSTDLSSKTKLPFYIAADQPGTYLETTVGESGYANHQIDSNTIGFWHLEEESGSGAYIKNSSENEHHATPTGTNSVSGKIGKGREFTGSSSYLTIPHSTDFNITNNITLEAWINPDTIESAGSWDRIIEKGTNNQYSLSVTTASSYGFIMRLYGTSTVSYISHIIPPTGEWSHVAATYDGSNVKFYLNGSLVKTVAGTGSITTTSNDLVIGDWTSHSRGFDGKIDEVRISNSARTADEIRQSYEIGLRTHPITIDFKASLDSGNLIANSADTSFTIDSTSYGGSNMGDNLYKGDKIIIKENIGETEYLAQGTVTAITTVSGATTVASWDTGSTFPSSGYTTNATVFKWQREYFDLGQSLSTHRDAITDLTFRITDGSLGTNIWLDDFKSNANYLTDPSGSTITSSIGNRYFQYRAIFSSWDEEVSATMSAVTLNYVSNSAPNTPTLDTPSDTASNQILLPTLKTTATDSDSDYLRYKIEVCENEGMTTNCNTYDQTSSQDGWSGQNTQTSTAYTSGTQATYTLQSNLSTNTTYYWRSYAIDPGGKNEWSETQGTPYSFTTTSAPTAPTAPYTEGETNPSGVTDTTPEFSAVHNDGDGDSANYYQIEVNTASGFDGTEMWDSGKQSMTATADSVRSPDISYAGTSLVDGTTYYWRIKFWDVVGAEGAWSAAQNFTMSSAPNTPTLDTPSDTASNQILLPTLKTTATDSDSDYLRYKIEVCENEGMTTNCNTYDQTSSQDGWSGQNTQTSTAYTSGTQATYTLQSNLSTNTTYYWRSYAIDPGGKNEWSETQGTPYSFTTTSAPILASQCLIEEARDDSQLVITWLDIASTEDGYEIQRSVNGGEWISLQTYGADTTSHTDDTVAQNTTYQYRIAPYYTGPVYSSWCLTSTVNLGVGSFRFDSIKLEGLRLD